MNRLGQALVRVIATLAGLVAGLQVLGGLAVGLRAAGPTLLGVAGVFGVPLVLFAGTRVLLPRPGLRRRLRSVAVVSATTGAGVALVSVTWPIVRGAIDRAPLQPAPAWLGDTAATLMCLSGGLIAVLVASALWESPEPPVP